MKFAVFFRLYGRRPLTQLATRRIDTGWYSLEWSSWSLEIEIPNSIDLFFYRLLRRPAPKAEPQPTRI